MRVGETLTAMTLAMMSELNMATMTPIGVRVGVRVRVRVRVEVMVMVTVRFRG